MHIVDWRNRLYIFIHNLTKKKQTVSRIKRKFKKGKYFDIVPADKASNNVVVVRCNMSIC